MNTRTLEISLDTLVALPPDVGEPSAPSVGALVDWRYKAGINLEQAIQSIHSLPGFDRFPMAPSEDQLKTSAASGPIVVLNVSEYRCDGLIIETGKLQYYISACTDSLMG